MEAPNILLINNPHVLFSTKDCTSFYRDDVPARLADMIERGYVVWIRSDDKDFKKSIIPKWMLSIFNFIDDSYTDDMIFDYPKSPDSLTIDFKNDMVACCGKCYNRESIFGDLNNDLTISYVAQKLKAEIILIITDKESVKVTEPDTTILIQNKPDIDTFDMVQTGKKFIICIKHPGTSFINVRIALINYLKANSLTAKKFIALVDSDTQFVPDTINQIRWSL